MQFIVSEDIEAPIEFVFSQVTDFDRIEKTALRRGADIARTDALQQTGAGMTWEGSFVFRGKTRKMKAVLSEYDAPNQIKFDSRIGGLEAVVVVELIALSKTRTRLRYQTDLKPHNIPARLLYQSLKLVRGNVEKRMRSRLAEYAKELEDRHTKVA